MTGYLTNTIKQARVDEISDWVPNKYNKTDDLDIVDEIKICVWVPNKYNKQATLI